MQSGLGDDAPGVAPASASHAAALSLQELTLDAPTRSEAAAGAGGEKVCERTAAPAPQTEPRRRRVHVCASDGDLQRLARVFADLRERHGIELCGAPSLSADPCQRPCAAAAVIFVVTRASALDPALEEGLHSALSAGRDVYPLSADGCDPDALRSINPALRMRLGSLQWQMAFCAADGLDPGSRAYLAELARFASALGELRGSGPRDSRSGLHVVGRTRSAGQARDDRDALDGLRARHPTSSWFAGDALAPGAPPVRVFVSYGHADGKRVEAVKDALEDLGISCWFDKLQLTSGVWWVDEVARGVQHCTHLVFFASTRSVASQYCAEELQFAYDEKKAIAVCYVDPREEVERCSPPSLRMRLRKFASCDLQGDHKASAELLGRIVTAPESRGESALPGPLCANCALHLRAEPEPEPEAAPAPEEDARCGRCERPLAIQGDLRFEELFGEVERPADLAHLLERDRRYALERRLRAADGEATFEARRVEGARREGGGEGLAVHEGRGEALAVDVFRGAEDAAWCGRWEAARLALARAAWLRLYGVPTLWDSSSERRAIAKTLAGGSTVRTELQRRRRFSDEAVASFLEQMALVLHALHEEASLLHHGVSTSSVLVSSGRERHPPQFMLRDLGLARPRRAATADPMLRQIPVFAGAAGEESGAPGPELDIVGVGVVALAMLRRTDGTPLEELWAELEGSPSTGPLAQTSPQLRRILARCIQAEGPARIRSARELWAAVQGCSPSILPSRDFAAEANALVRAQVEDVRWQLRRLQPSGTGAGADLSPGPSGAPLALLSVKIAAPAERADPFAAFDVLRRAARRAGGVAVAAAACYAGRGLVRRLGRGSALVALEMPSQAVDALLGLDPRGPVAASLAACGVLEIASEGGRSLRLPECQRRVCLEWGGSAHLLDGFVCDVGAQRQGTVDEGGASATALATDASLPQSGGTWTEKGWDPAKGKLDLSLEGRAAWPAAEIERVGPANIRELDLSSNTLASLAVPAGQLARLSRLERLHLGCNQLTALPGEIGRLTALRGLYVSSNRLSILPAEIQHLSALEQLYVDNNGLNFLPPEIGQLSALQLLDVQSNQLALLPPQIGHLAALKELYVAGNQLTDLPPEIGSLSALHGLYVTNNELSELPEEVGRLSALEELYARGNQLASITPEVGRLAALQVLDVSCNLLASLPAEIGRLLALRELSASSNRLVTVPAAIGRLPALETLELYDNPLTDLPAAARVSDDAALEYLRSLPPAPFGSALAPAEPTK